MDHLRRIFKKKEPPKPSVIESEATQNPTKLDESKLCKADFEVLKVLGQHSFAKVVLCRFKRNQKIYAMKILRKAGVVESDRVKDVLTEKNILRRVDHPFLLKLRLTFQDETHLFVVMDFFQGGDLESYLNNQSQKRLEYETARFYAAQILTAIQYLHQHNCIYRDLKPENILLAHDGNCVLADFGLSKEFSHENEGDVEKDPLTGEGEQRQLMRTTSFVGSPFYIAPEVLKRKGYTQSVDYWSYGILVYRMLLGHVPFVGRNPKEIFENIRTSELRFSSNIVLPGVCRDFLSRLLTKDGAARLQGLAVREHPYFSGLDWQKVEKKVYSVPQWKLIEPIDQFLSRIKTQTASTATTTPPRSDGLCDTLGQSLTSAGTDCFLEGNNFFEGFTYAEPPLCSGNNSSSVSTKSRAKTIVET